MFFLVRIIILLVKFLKNRRKIGNKSFGGCSKITNQKPLLCPALKRLKWKWYYFLKFRIIPFFQLENEKKYMITNGDENDTSLLFFPESKVNIKKYSLEMNYHFLRKIQKVMLTQVKKIRNELITKTLDSHRV